MMLHEARRTHRFVQPQLLHPCLKRTWQQLPRLLPSCLLLHAGHLASLASAPFLTFVLKLAKYQPLCCVFIQGHVHLMIMSNFEGIPYIPCWLAMLPPCHSLTIIAGLMEVEPLLVGAPVCPPFLAALHVCYV